MKTPTAAHPAKFSPEVLAVIADQPEVSACRVDPIPRVLDPFAGVGLLAEFKGILPYCVELEPEWATQLVANTLHLPFADHVFDGVITSPCYGNRMADHHEANDYCKTCSGAGYLAGGRTCPQCGGERLSRRHTYRHTLGRPLHPKNSGQFQWGEKYRSFHILAWAEVVRTLRPGGFFVLNCSDHIRDGRLARVTSWHLDTLEQLGLSVLREVHVATRRQKHGANRLLRVDHETVAVLKKQR
jgi:DNA modification methylase